MICIARRIFSSQISGSGESMNPPLSTVFVPVGLIIVAAKMGWDWYKRSRTQRDYRGFSTARKPTSATSDASLSKLVTACFGDKGKAERLITYELSKGSKSRSQAINAALDRLGRDRAR